MAGYWSSRGTVGSSCRGPQRSKAQAQSHPVDSVAPCTAWWLHFVEDCRSRHSGSSGACWAWPASTSSVQIWSKFTLVKNNSPGDPSHEIPVHGGKQNVLWMKAVSEIKTYNSSQPAVRSDLLLRWQESAPLKLKFFKIKDPIENASCIIWSIVRPRQ